MFLSLVVLADLFSDCATADRTWTESHHLPQFTHPYNVLCEVPVITHERAVHTRNSSTDGG